MMPVERMRLQKRIVDILVDDWYLAKVAVTRKLFCSNCSFLACTGY
jgi:hypothetical protein